MTGSVSLTGIGHDVPTSRPRRGTQAMMLEHAQITRGMRVLEIGSGGYNAALLAELVGPTGETPPSTSTRTSSTAPPGSSPPLVSPKRRWCSPTPSTAVPITLPTTHVIVTVPRSSGAGEVGAYGIPDAWFAQLAPVGRLVVPGRIRGSVSRSTAFERDNNGVWRSVDHHAALCLCGRGSPTTPRRKIPLIADMAVELQLNQEHMIDSAGLVGVA